MSILLTAWPDPAAPDGALFFARARKLVSLYRAAGFGIPVAVALMTMAESESGIDPNTVQEGNERTPSAFGALRRSLSRVLRIRDGRNGADGKIIIPGLGFDLGYLAIEGVNTIEHEARATLWELTTSAAFAAINGAKTAWGAAYQATPILASEMAMNATEAGRRAAAAETWVSLINGVWPRTRGEAPDSWRELASGW